MKNLKPSLDALGIDIGTHSIKILQLKGDKLIKVALAEINPETPLSSMPANEKETLISDILKKTISSNQINSKKAIISVSGDAVVVRYIILPKMSEKQLESTIKYEAEPHISFPIDQAILDFQILADNDEEKETKRMDVLLVAGKKELIDRQIAIVKNAGLRPVLIDVDAFAMQNLYEYCAGQQTNSDGVVLLNIGATFTNINIVENGISRFTRDVSIAGNNFTRALQRDLRLDYRKAEELKRAKSIMLTEEEENNDSLDKETAQVSDLLKSVFHELIGEIRRSLDYYQSQSNERTIKKVILSGGSSRIKNIEKIITQEIKLPVERINPFVGLNINAKYCTPEQVEDIGPFFSVCRGLMLRLSS